MIATELPDSDRHDSSSSAPDADTYTAKANIAVVDDHDGVREAILTVLEYAGYQVTGYATGRAVLDDVAAAARFDCVVLDLEMPGMNGAQVLEELRKTEYSTPILVVTGTRDDVLLSAAATAPVVLTLHKPIGRATLLAAIEQVVSAPTDR